MQYEYFVKFVDSAHFFLERELEAFGKDGWELVAVLQGRNDWDYKLFFKRTIQNSRP